MTLLSNQVEDAAEVVDPASSGITMTPSEVVPRKDIARDDPAFEQDFG